MYQWEPYLFYYLYTYYDLSIATKAIDILILKARPEKYISDKSSENFSWHYHAQFLKNSEISTAVQTIFLVLNRWLHVAIDVYSIWRNFFHSTNITTLNYSRNDRFDAFRSVLLVKTIELLYFLKTIKNSTHLTSRWSF